MPEKELRYETQEIKTLIGFEPKTIVKMENEGWELVSQVKGKLRTTLKFRRPKKPISSKVLLAGIAGVAILATVITVGAITENKNPPNTVSGDKQIEIVDETPTPAPEEPADEILTIENNKDLAKLLADRSDDVPFWKIFFEKYRGRTLEFDGNIAFMVDSPGYKYTVDCLIEAGDYNENSSFGPPFRAPLINIHTGFHVTNSEDRSTLFQGDNIRITAKLVDFNPRGETFEIDIVSTTLR